MLTLGLKVRHYLNNNLQYCLKKESSLAFDSTLIGISSIACIFSVYDISDLNSIKNLNPLSLNDISYFRKEYNMKYIDNVEKFTGCLFIIKGDSMLADGFIEEIKGSTWALNQNPYCKRHYYGDNSYLCAKLSTCKGK
jgi:hypothetical protein